MREKFKKFDAVPPHVVVTRGPFTLEAMHWLPNLPPLHKCARPHGHSYSIWIEIEGPIENYMVRGIEFDQIDLVFSAIKDSCCHHSWNDKIEIPTVEVIAYYIALQMKASLDVPLSVIVKEGPMGQARVSV